MNDIKFLEVMNVACTIDLLPVAKCCMTNLILNLRVILRLFDWSQWNNKRHLDDMEKYHSVRSVRSRTLVKQDLKMAP